MPRFPVPEGDDRGVAGSARKSGRDGRAATRAASRGGAPTRPSTRSTSSARGLPVVFPRRGRLRQRRTSVGVGSARAAVGGRITRRVRAGHHRPRPDPARPDLRAVPQPRARLDARHRRRLRRTPPRRDHPVRHREVGRDRVAQIVTFGTIKAKAAIKDSARVLGFPVRLGDRITKAMPPR